MAPAVSPQDLEGLSLREERGRCCGGACADPEGIITPPTSGPLISHMGGGSWGSRARPWARALERNVCLSHPSPH